MQEFDEELLGIVSLCIMLTLHFFGIFGRLLLYLVLVFL